MPATCKEKPNKQLQLALREWIRESSLWQVAKETQIGTDTLGRYLADLPLRAATFRGIEATIAMRHGAGAGGK